MELQINLQKKLGQFTVDSKFSLKQKRSGIFGNSGSGKSTLKHMLAGYTEADCGSITLDDTLLYCSSKGINITPEKRRIGVVFQHTHLFPHMNVKKNLLYGWKRTPQEERKIDPDTLCKVLDLTKLQNHNVAALSGGERQRVALARTMLASPRLILLDEPLTGLDNVLKFKIISYLNRVFSEFEIPFIFVSHSLMEMRLMTDTTLLMNNGSIAEEMPTDLLARTSWIKHGEGYTNLLKLGVPSPHRDLYRYTWGDSSLILTEEGNGSENYFELDARDILLFKRHPEAASARNILTCTVNHLATYGNRVRVELECCGNTLVAQIVPESVKELEISVGTEVVAAIKATSFKKLS